ncbi:MAG: aminotransferase class V-fold PLP-dependent enzyme, partial [Candidatus Neomarinimicrobiota bacterium]|nr:aminotransferase class V-fold PLP-dependent enzyme [Candidatus Neomarinimicrobiota bacterium]
MKTIKDTFLLDQNITFLNHGSFGSCPRPVFQEYQKWQQKLEHQPVQFMTEKVYSALKESRIALAEFVGCDQDELVFFPNPTTATTNIIFNLDLEPGDEILMTNHEYGALVRAWTAWGKRISIKIIQQNIPVPVDTEERFIEEFWKGVNARTKVIFISHITSPTALIFPIEKILARARDKGLITIVDGAHVPGQVDLDIHALGCDFYIGAIHKWLCGPKGSSFLFVKKEHQEWMKPLVYSWGKDGEDPGPSEFLQDFQWQGTRDMSAFLSIPAAIEFYHQEISGLQSKCHEMNVYAFSEFQSILGTKSISCGGNWLGQMVSHPLPDHASSDLKEKLWTLHQIEIPVFE